MKKLIIIIFLLPFIAFGQRYITGDTLVIYGGGSFGGEVKLINSIKVDSILTTIIDSDGALITAGAVVDYVTATIPDSINFKVDATNISQVQYIIGNDTIKESFDHMHNEYALKTNNNVDGLWEVDGSETQLIIADGIDMQTEGIINLKDPVANQDAATKKYVDDNNVDGLWEVDAEQLIMLSADQLGMQNQLIEDVLDPVKNQDAATKKYVDDNEVLLKTKIELTAANVNSLGTAFELLHIPGAGFNYKVIGISVKMITTTILDAGIQVLNFIYGTSGERIADLSNPHFEGTSGTSTKFSLVIELKDLPMDDNESIECVLNSGADPTGEAEMEVTIYYTLENY
jgi:hypothetical protein